MHQSNNEDTRKLMKVCTVHSTLRARRIKWIQNIIAHPAENEQLRAAVCGSLTTRAGTITTPYKAWLQIILEDIMELLETSIQLSKQGIHSYFYPLRTEMLQWEDQDLLEQLLMPTHMTWIRGVDPWIILRTYE